MTVNGHGLELIRPLTLEIGSGKAMSLTVAEEMNCVLKLEEDRKSGMIQNVTTKLFSCVVIQLRQQQLRLQQLRQQRKPVRKTFESYMIQFLLHYTKSVFSRSNLFTLHYIGDCEDKNELCQMEPAFLLDILCQIDTVKEQCPKRCNSCPEPVGNKLIGIRKTIFITK